MKSHILCTETRVLSVRCSTYKVGEDKESYVAAIYLPTNSIACDCVKALLSMNLEWILRKHKSCCKQELKRYLHEIQLKL